MMQQFFFWIIIWKKKMTIWKVSAPHVHCSTSSKARTGKYTKYPTMDESMRKRVCVYDGKLFNHKEGNFAICDTMDGIWRHYAKVE